MPETGQWLFPSCWHVCCDKTPDEGGLRKEGMTLVSQCEGRVHHGGEGGVAEVLSRCICCQVQREEY